LKYFFQISLFCIIFLTVIQAQERKIKIVADVDSLPLNSAVHITGGNEDLGYWNIMRKMNKKSDLEWWFELSAEKGDTLQFKFTRGDWSTEAVDSNGLEFPNFTLLVNNDTMVIYKLEHWRDFVQQKIIITKERLLNKGGFLELFEGWKYHLGDDTAWADPDFDDSEWKSIDPRLDKAEVEKINWEGNIWFRNKIYIDSTVWDVPFGLNFLCTGAADIYLNGRLLYSYGKVGSSSDTEENGLDRNPRHILFDKQNNQVIAIRYSNHSYDELLKFNINLGFTAVLGDLEVFIYNRVDNVRQISIHQMAFSAFVLAFSIMHLLLFIFYPKSMENLYYSISMLSFAAVIYTGTQNNFVNSITTALDISKVNSLGVQLSLLFGLLTVYASSYTKMPKQWIIFAAFSFFFVIQTIFLPEFLPEIINYIFYVFAIILTIEIFRVVIRSVKRKEPWGWGWIIGMGFIVAIILIAYQVLILTGVITQPLFGIYLVYVYGIVFLAITVSINLAKKTADTHKNLEKQLIQVKELSQKTIEQERRVKEDEFTRKLLEADNERKTKELEEARQLQLSMLPKNLPDVPGYEIAVYMKTASEVGGDYYDFKYDHNGTLLIAVGDATGHGMKAGTMVATVKGLFTAEQATTDLVSFLNKSNSIIRDMRLGNIYMAMLIAKIENDNVSISSAGMPPALIYRQGQKIVDEIKLQAIPLGGAPDFQYAKSETILNEGETLLLMSDGFPELFNSQKEILDYSRAREIFLSIGSLSASEIIKHLVREAEHWKGNAKQEDDMTFVVVKRK